MADFPIKPPPVLGYQPISENALDRVNTHKRDEEELLRLLDYYAGLTEAGVHVVDQRWLSIARTHFEQGYVALNRAIFKPKRLAE